MREKLDLFEVARAVRALVKAGLTARDLMEIEECPELAQRIVLTIRENDTGEPVRALCSTLFEVDIPVYFTEWVLGCTNQHGYSFITISSEGNSNGEGLWYAELLLQQPTFIPLVLHRAVEKPVISLVIRTKEDRKEFDRILKQDFDAVKVITMERAVLQPESMTVLKLEKEQQPS